MRPSSVVEHHVQILYIPVIVSAEFVVNCVLVLRRFRRKEIDAALMPANDTGSQYRSA